MLWSSVQRFGTMTISFVANIVLARLLTPEDFGIIGMIMVFIALSDTLVNGGFASALIQKKEPTDIDYSTVFYWNLGASLFFFLILYFSAPAIAAFYSMPKLSLILRVLGIQLFINAFNLIQHNQLVKQLNFKRLARINIIATIVGAVVGITMALLGYGVWSLVVKLLIISFAQALMLWLGSSWRPLWYFSWSSFRQLFSFGSMMLLSSLAETLVANLQKLIIGRVFSARDLGFYVQAKKLHSIPERSLPQIVSQVTFPVFSSIQDNPNRMLGAVKKSMKSLAFINFPLMTMLIVVAEPLINLLLTDRWSDSIPYFQILCFGGMMYSLNSNNVNIMKALGKSNYVFFAGLIKRSITILFILIGLQFGLTEMIIGYSASMYFWFFVNAYFSGKLINYGIVRQVSDLGFNYLTSLGAAIVTIVFTRNLDVNMYYLIIIQAFMFLGLYLLLSRVFKLEGFMLLLENIKDVKEKRKSL